MVAAPWLRAQRPARWQSMDLFATGPAMGATTATATTATAMGRWFFRFFRAPPYSLLFFYFIVIYYYFLVDFRPAGSR